MHHILFSVWLAQVRSGSQKLKTNEATAADVVIFARRFARPSIQCAPRAIATKNMVGCNISLVEIDSD